MVWKSIWLDQISSEPNPISTTTQWDTYRISCSPNLQTRTPLDLISNRWSSYRVENRSYCCEVRQQQHTSGRDTVASFRGAWSEIRVSALETDNPAQVISCVQTRLALAAMCRSHKNTRLWVSILVDACGGRRSLLVETCDLDRTLH